MSDHNNDIGDTSDSIIKTIGAILNAEVCPACDGGGFLRDDDDVRCSECDGFGYVVNK